MPKCKKCDKYKVKFNLAPIEPKSDQPRQPMWESPIKFPKLDDSSEIRRNALHFRLRPKE